MFLTVSVWQGLQITAQSFQTILSAWPSIFKVGKVSMKNKQQIDDVLQKGLQLIVPTS